MRSPGLWSARVPRKGRSPKRRWRRWRRRCRRSRRSSRPRWTCCRSSRRPRWTCSRRSRRRTSRRRRRTRLQRRRRQTISPSHIAKSRVRRFCGDGGHHERTDGWNCKARHPQYALNKLPPIRCYFVQEAVRRLIHFYTSRAQTFGPKGPTYIPLSAQRQ